MPRVSANFWKQGQSGDFYKKLPHHICINGEKVNPIENDDATPRACMPGSCQPFSHAQTANVGQNRVKNTNFIQDKQILNRWRTLTSRGQKEELIWPIRCILVACSLRGLNPQSFENGVQSEDFKKRRLCVIKEKVNLTECSGCTPISVPAAFLTQTLMPE